MALCETPFVNIPSSHYCSNLYIFPTDAEGSEFVGLSMHAMDLANKVDYAVGAVTNSGFEKIVELNPQSTDYVVLAVSGYNGDFSGNTAEHEGRHEEYGMRPDGKEYAWTRNICPSRIYVGIKGKMEDGKVSWQKNRLSLTVFHNEYI